MQILALGTEAKCSELSAESPGINWLFTVNPADFISREGVDAYFNLRDDAHEFDYGHFNNPVFVNSVHVTRSKLKHGENVIRINGWNGFIQKSIWEVSGIVTENAAEVLQTLKKEFVVLPDEPGFVSARIIAMIINEAYFAKSENVSSENEIDIAMKLGTNYPYGPFEWAKKIGLNNIYDLLKSLSEADSRYTPNSQLESEVVVKS